MKPQSTLDSVTTPDGHQLVLYERDHVYTIRVNGRELMTSRTHGSEEALAALACARLATRASATVLVGGLGMGYTLRAVLDLLPPQARVVVAEVFLVVVEWCRGPLADLAGNVLADPRVEVATQDVAEVLAGRETLWDAILLDVDNGPEALTLASNQRLYDPTGLRRARARLASGGTLAVWSAGPDQSFSRRLGRAGFRVWVERVRARPGARGPWHTIFVAKVPGQ